MLPQSIFCNNIKYRVEIMLKHKEKKMVKKKKIKPVTIRFNYCRCGRPIELWQTNCGLGCPCLTRLSPCHKKNKI